MLEHKNKGGVEIHQEKRDRVTESYVPCKESALKV